MIFKLCDMQCTISEYSEKYWITGPRCWDSRPSILGTENRNQKGESFGDICHVVINCVIEGKVEEKTMRLRPKMTYSAQRRWL